MVMGANFIKTFFLFPPIIKIISYHTYNHKLKLR